MKGKALPWTAGFFRRIMAPELSQKLIKSGPLNVEIRQWAPQSDLPASPLEEVGIQRCSKLRDASEGVLLRVDVFLAGHCYGSFMFEVKTEWP